MKVFSSEHDFDYSWEEVSTANWVKYCPWNKESSHVIAVDTLSRRVDAATGILRSERLITCKQSAPKWMMSLLGGAEVSHVYEVSYVHPSTAENPIPSVKMISYNLTYSDLISVRETVTYSPSPEDPLLKTRFEQHASITALCGGWQRIREKIEAFTVERFGQNAEKGRLGFESVLEMSRIAFSEEREKERRKKIWRGEARI